MWHTMHSEKKSEADVDTGGDKVEQGDLLGNFVRRTDNDFRGVKDQSLIGEDIGDDDEEANEDELPAKP
ncbi:hypothetical protein [Aureimonas psammosilenae]|uniref:hypothetical protein n=1 Tax=Aureimonas psammosilenae TaxID=2495496 RepID=UPI0012609E66|nr:hypothetical protein [Aureimonas psammosilenae]